MLLEVYQALCGWVARRIHGPMPDTGHLTDLQLARLHEGVHRRTPNGSGVRDGDEVGEGRSRAPGAARVSRTRLRRAGHFLASGVCEGGETIVVQRVLDPGTNQPVHEFDGSFRIALFVACNSMPYEMGRSLPLRAAELAVLEEPHAGH